MKETVNVERNHYYRYILSQKTKEKINSEVVRVINDDDDITCSVEVAERNPALVVKKEGAIGFYFVDTVTYTKENGDYIANTSENYSNNIYYGKRINSKEFIEANLDKPECALVIASFLLNDGHYCLLEDGNIQPMGDGDLTMEEVENFATDIEKKDNKSLAIDSLYEFGEEFFPTAEELNNYLSEIKIKAAMDLEELKMKTIDPSNMDGDLLSIISKEMSYNHQYHGTLFARRIRYIGYFAGKTNVVSIKHHSNFGEEIYVAYQEDEICRIKCWDGKMWNSSTIIKEDTFLRFLEKIIGLNNLTNNGKTIALTKKKED